MEIDCIGLFVNNMEIMVKFYRDIIGLKTKWNGEQNADLKAGKCRLIMYGRDDFEKMVSKTFNYPKTLNGTMEIAFNLNNYDDVDKEYNRLMNLGVKSVFPPTTMSWGQRTCYVSDPEGNLLEIGSFGKTNMDNLLQNELINNLHKIHTTELGTIRIKQNLKLETSGIVKWCLNQIKNAEKIIKDGKNWYVYKENCIITINANSYTIITAHKAK